MSNVSKRLEFNLHDAIGRATKLLSTSMRPPAPVQWLQP